MALPQNVTAIIVLCLKNGVNLDSNASSGSDASFQSFVQMINTIKSQEGYISQYWGHQVENPNLFVWFINWKSLAHATAFHNSIVSKRDNDFLTYSMSKIFDTQTTAPLTCEVVPLLLLRLATYACCCCVGSYLLLSKSDHNSVFTRWTSDAKAPTQSVVTEVAFYEFEAPIDISDEEAKAAVELALEPILQDVITVGKGTGAAIGWVLETSPYEHPLQHTSADDSEGKNRAWLAGVFGYDHINDHYKWRQTPEHGQAGEIFAGLENRGLKLRIAVSVPGVDTKTGYFHVKFRQGDM